MDGFEGLSAIQIAAYGKIIANFGAVCGLTFTKTAGPNADLRFAQATDVDYSDGNSLHVPGLLPGTAEAMAPDPEHATVSWGDVWFSHDEFPRGNDNSHPVLGNFIYTAAFMHELGHAVGLKHGMISQSGHGYNFPPLPADHDLQEYSVMTYNTSPGVKGGTDQYPQSLMQDDIVALQYIYGANYKSNSGATNYRWDPHTGQEFVNGVGQGTPVANFIFLTVWDGGGTDLYDFSAYASALKIDLRPGAWTNLGTQIANLGGGHFARGNIANALTDPNNPGETASLIENVTSGSGNDTITGNVVANRLSGGNGNDTLDGREGDDSLFGAAGNDQIVGGVGNDLLAGGVGNDTLTGGVGLDKYLFDTGLNTSTNLDTIADMVPGGDLVVLDQTIFAKLKIGVLKARFFTVGKHADDKNDYLIYNKKSGELFYDANGDHHGGRVEFAQLSAHLSLSNNDFLVVA